MTTTIQPALAFLHTNILRNIVLLKMLALFPNALQCHYCEEGGAAGVLILLPTAVSSFDRHTYPAYHCIPVVNMLCFSRSEIIDNNMPIGAAPLWGGPRED